MGKALYRKYRSKSLDDIVGQKHITDTLRHALKKGAISHAYLFTGPRGTGKTSIARILAHEINQLTYDEESTHLDIIEIDAASNRRIDEIRDLRDKVHIAPTSSKYKVYIIDEVHMLTREAFNALLKTLEEPPDHAVFILATTELHKVPDTIVSRTQKYTFRLYDTSEVTGHLRSISEAEKIAITDEALKLLADHGRGSFRDSISMLDQIAGFSYDKITHEHVAKLLGVPNKDLLDTLLEAVGSGNSNALFETTATLREQGAQSSRVAQSLINLLREGLRSGTSNLDNKLSISLMKSLLPLTGGNSSSESLEIALLDNLAKSEPETIQPTTVIETQNTASTLVQPEKMATNTTEVESINETESKAPKDTKPKAQSTSAPTNTQSKTAENTRGTEADKQQNTKSTAPKVQSEKAQEPSKTTSSGDPWKQVLTNVKKENGTLHGILRMADVVATEESLTLAFQFAFHKNQLAKPANMKMFLSYVEQAYGSKRELIMDVKAKPNQTSKTNEQTNAPVDSEQIEKKTENADLKNISNIFGDAELLD